MPMTDVASKYFDYLPIHGIALQKKLGSRGLEKKIRVWRENGLDIPEEVATGCRRVIEKALKVLVDDPEITKLHDLIRYAEDEGIISKSLFYKLETIRKVGNGGAHRSTKVNAARQSLQLLDDILRWLIVYWEIAPDISPDVAPGTDDVFIDSTNTRAKATAAKASIAASLSGDESIKHEARRAKTAADAQQAEMSSSLNQMQLLIEQSQAIVDNAQPDEKTSVENAQSQLFDNCDQLLEDLHDASEALSHEIDVVDRRVEEILSEYDYIEKLLKADGRAGKATDAQFEVMAFPKSSNTTTSILQIDGGAGTGKTLCLLAKLIAEINAHGQTTAFKDMAKSALFVCFNTALADYVDSMLSKYPEVSGQIEVVNYDSYVNALVKGAEKRVPEHLRGYAEDVRYPPNWKIKYSGELKNVLKDAMGTIAKKHPKKKNEYYLDNSSADNVDWLMDEILWLESRYENEADAAVERGTRNPYLIASRVGRGTKKRPSKEVRKVILEVWAEWRKRLAAQNTYTIEQATKRLLESKHLPKHDAIAIDEVQDFSLQSIQFLLRLRKNPGTSRVYISGDEDQKIFQRDFTWKELDSNIKGYTITLRDNKRNLPAIRYFAERLDGAEHATADILESDGEIYIKNGDANDVANLARRLRNLRPNESTALIGNTKYWCSVIERNDIDYACLSDFDVDITSPNLYILGPKKGKGLEFDNVIVDYRHDVEEDFAAEKRLRYVHFTRARHRLYILYNGEPPTLLRKIYGDFLIS